MSRYPELKPWQMARISPEERINGFAQRLERQIAYSALEMIEERARELKLEFTKDELRIFSALNTPARVQRFLDTEIYYNRDHTHVTDEETAMSPRRVLQTGKAHCFEGALFAYTANYLHFHYPKWSLLLATTTPEHNLVVYTDKTTGLLGSNAHSGYSGLQGKPATFEKLQELVHSYDHFYFSDATMDERDQTLVGYAEPFDMVEKFGTEWMTASENLWKMYYTYIDSKIKFRYYLDGGASTRMHPSLEAVNRGWVSTNGNGKPHVNVSALPSEAQGLWKEFWKQWNLRKKIDKIPRGEIKVIEERFRQITYMSPIDLRDYAFDMQFFFKEGFRIEDVLK